MLSRKRASDKTSLLSGEAPQAQAQGVAAQAAQPDMSWQPVQLEAGPSPADAELPVLTAASQARITLDQDDVRMVEAASAAVHEAGAAALRRLFDDPDLEGGQTGQGGDEEHDLDEDALEAHAQEELTEEERKLIGRMAVGRLEDADWPVFQAVCAKLPALGRAFEAEFSEASGSTSQAPSEALDPDDLFELDPSTQAPSSSSSSSSTSRVGRRAKKMALTAHDRAKHPLVAEPMGAPGTLATLDKAEDALSGETPDAGGMGEVAGGLGHASAAVGAIDGMRKGHDAFKAQRALGGGGADMTPGARHEHERTRNKGLTAAGKAAAKTAHHVTKAAEAAGASGAATAAAYTGPAALVAGGVGVLMSGQRTVKDASAARNLRHLHEGQGADEELHFARKRTGRHAVQNGVSTLTSGIGLAGGITLAAASGPAGWALAATGAVGGLGMLAYKAGRKVHKYRKRREAASEGRVEMTRESFADRVIAGVEQGMYPFVQLAEGLGVSQQEILEDPVSARKRLMRAV